MAAANRRRVALNPTVNPATNPTVNPTMTTGRTDRAMDAPFPAGDGATPGRETRRRQRTDGERP